MGAHHCAEVFIRGDGLIEKDESFHVIFSTTAPDFIPPKRSAVEVTIKEDNDSKWQSWVKFIFVKIQI